jgi:hypothetical protein
VTELGAFLLPVVPLLVLLAFLLFGRYPGSEVIARLAERRGSRDPARRVAAAVRPPRPPRAFAPGGGVLLALSLSGRAPPA